LLLGLSKCYKMAYNGLQKKTLHAELDTKSQDQNVGVFVMLFDVIFLWCLWFHLLFMKMESKT